jgi:cyanophycinase-like exopeptidase
VQTAVERVLAKGGAVGGTSAGLAIQGEYVYDACTGSAPSRQALRDPYHPEISFTRDFFRWPGLEKTMTDSHFGARDRMGRLLSYLARQVVETGTAPAWGLGVEEGDIIVVDRDGRATVFGSGNSYLVLADHTPEQCSPGLPLTHTGFKIWRYPAGSVFDMNARPTTGYTSIDVVDGGLSGNPY